MLVLGLLIIVAGAVWGISRTYAPGTLSEMPIATGTYYCSAGKTVTAAYFTGKSTPAEVGKPPVPGGHVALTLSDGRTFALLQTISADGGRYANADESVVFWNKGNGITFTENGAQTFTGCIEAAADPGGLSQVYESGPQGFSIRYPQGFIVDQNYAYQALGPGKNIAGVKFTIPAAAARGTNLSPDTYMSVEEIPQVSSCVANLFLAQGTPVRTVKENGTTYSVASSTDAAAGNRYEETVYAIPGTNPCMAVRYLVHYGVIENYPAGTVQEFDRQALLDQFDTIRGTLSVLAR